MWHLVERLVTTLWMLRAPVAFCALIFGGMAVVNEVGSRHDRYAAPTAEKACTNSDQTQRQGDKPC